MDIQILEHKITFDLSKMTYGQYKGLFDPQESEEKSDVTIARVCGLTLEQLNDLPYLEERRLMQAFFKKCREPLSDPNSPSAPS
jgi:outer membrane receptor for ferric coprogen and ferric-rhodotorulic acid